MNILMVVVGFSFHVRLEAFYSYWKQPFCGCGVVKKLERFELIPLCRTDTFSIDLCTILVCPSTKS